ncbi:MAG TPA: TonB family protein [Candidatus Acidoferrum sp.]
MSDFWKQCEGQVIDNKFRLRHHLGGTDDSAVFLTQLAAPQSQKAAIKFITAGPTADLQISLWLRIMQLSQPNLLRVFDVGRCRIENRDRLYVVMEYAEEDLSQILPQRALTASEARDMLEPVLDALVYLHGQGLVHSRVKPSNILATADQLKLSSDTLFPIGESRKSLSKFDVHDAPETLAFPLSPAADVWSLGMTLVEALTQHAPASPSGSQADPLVPDTLPQPFLDVARHALRRDPRRRWTIPEIAARLNPVAAAAAAGQSLSPLAVPLPPVTAVPAAKLPVPKLDTPLPRPQAQPPRPQSTNARKQTLVLPNYVVPAAAVLLVIVAVIALPKILSRRPDSSSSAAASSAPAAAPPKLAEQPSRREISPAPKPSAPKPLAPSAKPDSLKAAAEKKPVSPPPSSSVAQPNSSPVAAPIPASVRTDTFPSANAPITAASSSARGEVLDQVLPEVSEKARATIHGVVRVGVRVKVDPTGNVSEAVLDSPGPSQYFADLAMKAARRWQFTSPEAGGHSTPSEWLIRFHFTPTGTKAIPTQTAP